MHAGVTNIKLLFHKFNIFKQFNVINHVKSEDLPEKLFYRVKGTGTKNVENVQMKYLIFNMQFAQVLLLSSVNQL